MTAITAKKDDEDKAFIMNLYKDYYGLVRKTIYSITHDANNTEDLINDTFIKLIEKTSLIRSTKIQTPAGRMLLFMIPVGIAEEPELLLI